MRVVEHRWCVGGLLLACLVGSGCESTPNTAGGAILGTGLGAVTGAIIGSATGRGNAAAGALIGAAAGGAGGAMLGHAEDARQERDQAIAQAQYAREARAAEMAALSNTDIVYMTRNGLSDQVIVGSIRSRGGRFDTTPEGIIELKKSGVSDHVVQVMQATPPPAATVPPPMVVPGPYYAGGVVVAPPPPVGIYVGPSWRGRRWHRW
jgi:hypothetical protein